MGLFLLQLQFAVLRADLRLHCVEIHLVSKKGPFHLVSMDPLRPIVLQERTIFTCVCDSFSIATTTGLVGLHQTDLGSAATAIRLLFRLRQCIQKP